MKIEAGQTHSVLFPFSRSTMTDLSSGDFAEIPSWKPGCLHGTDEEGESIWTADAHGEMLLEVVDVHKPGSYPERVFYLRRWRSPDGTVFGKPCLRITASSNFRKMLRGYRHDYQHLESGISSKS